MTKRRPVLKTVINALQYLDDSSGIGILLRELFGRVAQRRDRCQVILPKGSKAFPCGEKTETVVAPCSYEESFRRIAYQSFVVGPRYCKDALFLTTDSKVPILLPKNTKILPVVTDLAVFRMPEAYRFSRVLLWKLQFRTLCSRADRFVAISEFTKREMTELLGIPEQSIQVVYCAAPEHIVQVCSPTALDALRVKYRLPERFVLFVGNFNPRKNIERLIAAFDQMKQRSGLQVSLVIAGAQGWKFDRSIALRGVSSAKDILFVGYVPDEEMAALYSAAELFVFPSLYEGFGIPVIEAQKCGTPVLTSNTSALPEVGGDGAVYVDPMDVAGLSNEMETLLQSQALQESMIAKGKENAARFSWEESAQQLTDYIERSVEA